ncbi:hypothetical protein QTV43_000025 [Vibrio vulnificus]|nr:hypothetical protein [Vibrio vulnificus]
MKKTFYARGDGFIIITKLTRSIGTNKSFDGFLYASEQPDSPLKMFNDLRFKFIEFTDGMDVKDELEVVKIDDLIGNGDHSNLCNKGYGTWLATSTLNLIQYLYCQESKPTVKVVGELSDVGDKNEASHERRVHFWSNKVNLTVNNHNDHYSSIHGNLANIPQGIPPSDFIEIETDDIEKIIEDLTWSDRDEFFLSQVKKLANTEIDKSQLTKIKHECERLSRSKANLTQLIQYSIPVLSGACLYAITSHVGVSMGVGLLAAIGAKFFTDRLPSEELSDKQFDLNQEKSRVRQAQNEIVERIVEIDNGNFNLIHRASQNGRFNPEHLPLNEMNNNRLMRYTSSGETTLEKLKLGLT